MAKRWSSGAVFGKASKELMSRAQFRVSYSLSMPVRIWTRCVEYSPLVVGDMTGKGWLDSSKIPPLGLQRPDTSDQMTGKGTCLKCPDLTVFVCTS